MTPHPHLEPVRQSEQSRGRERCYRPAAIYRSNVKRDPITLAVQAFQSDDHCRGRLKRTAAFFFGAPGMRRATVQDNIEHG